MGPTDEPPAPQYGMPDTSELSLPCCFTLLCSLARLCLTWTAVSLHFPFRAPPPVAVVPVRSGGHHPIFEAAHAMRRGAVRCGGAARSRLHRKT
jgi:hypothetical protein